MGYHECPSVIRRCRLKGVVFILDHQEVEFCKLWFGSSRDFTSRSIAKRVTTLRKRELLYFFTKRWQMSQSSQSYERTISHSPDSLFANICRPLPPVARGQSEDIEMGDDVASIPAESSHGPLSPTPNGASQSLASVPSQPPRARPKLDLSSFTNPAGSRNGERRKGKSIFGVVLGTLNKAKIEDKQRMASDAVSYLSILILRRDSMNVSHSSVFRPKSDKVLTHDSKQSSLVSKI